MATARSLHIGVNRTSRSSYPDGYFRTLFGCDLAANEMFKLAGERGIKDRTVLTTPDQTRLDNTRKWFTETIDSDCGYVLFTFAGHGDVIPATNGPEKVDQALVFYDTELLDNEIFRWLTSFREDVVVIIVADCCYGGGIIDRSYTPQKAEANNVLRALARLQHPQVRADVVLLSAGRGDRDVDGSMCSDEPPPFTKRLIAATHQGAIKGGYAALKELAGAYMVSKLGTRRDLATAGVPFAIPDALGVTR